MIDAILVGLGGFTGSVSRYLIGSLITKITKNHLFPYGTLFVNLLGCLLIGYVMGIMETKGILNESSRLFLVVGLLGGFTTFSTFTYDTLFLFRASQIFYAYVNIILQVSVCLIAAWLGHYLSQQV